MNINLSLELAQIINKQQVKQSTIERLVKELLSMDKDTNRE